MEDARMWEKSDSERINALIKEKMLKRLPMPDRIAPPVEGLTLTRRGEISQAESCFYQPMVAFVAQGFKRAMLGNEEYRYGERHCMVVGVDMPGVYYITEASPKAPFLSLSINMTRLYGRSYQGERCYDMALCGHWESTTILSSIRLDGKAESIVFDGSVDRKMFDEYIREVLGPTLHPGDIVVMDNLKSVNPRLCRGTHKV
jgi:hypothetical protein